MLLKKIVKFFTNQKVKSGEHHRAHLSVRSKTHTHKIALVQIVGESCALNNNGQIELQGFAVAKSHLTIVANVCLLKSFPCSE